MDNQVFGVICFLLSIEMYRLLTFSSTKSVFNTINVWNDRPMYMCRAYCKATGHSV